MKTASSTQTPAPFRPVVLAVGLRVHCYAPRHYNRRGEIIGANSHGRFTVRLDGGAVILVPGCDLEAC